jgi:hypothetical protein
LDRARGRARDSRMDVLEAIIVACAVVAVVALVALTIAGRR